MRKHPIPDSPFWQNSLKAFSIFTLYIFIFFFFFLCLFEKPLQVSNYPISAKPNCQFSYITLLDPLAAFTRIIVNSTLKHFLHLSSSPSLSPDFPLPPLLIHLFWLKWSVNPSPHLLSIYIVPLIKSSCFNCAKCTNLNKNNKFQHVNFNDIPAKERFKM